jgi:hypothetical protein
LAAPAVAPLRIARDANSARRAIDLQRALALRWRRSDKQDRCDQRLDQQMHEAQHRRPPRAAPAHECGCGITR